MLWLCLSLPQLPVEALAPSDTVMAAVIERVGAKRRLVACNAPCAERGVQARMDAATAMVLAPELHLLERSLRRERDALIGLAAWAGQFTAFVSFDPQRLLLWLEIGSVLRYFGGLEALLAR